MEGMKRMEMLIGIALKGNKNNENVYGVSFMNEMEIMEIFV